MSLHFYTAFATFFQFYLRANTIQIYNLFKLQIAIYLWIGSRILYLFRPFFLMIDLIYFFSTTYLLLISNPLGLFSVFRSKLSYTYCF